MALDIRETVKSNLIRLRKENKLTQLELSQKINYSDKAISRWETGEVTPDVETLSALAALYQIPITAFFLSQEVPLSKKERRAMRKSEKQLKKQEKRADKLAAAPARKEPSDFTLSRRVALLIFGLCFFWTVVLSLFFVLKAYPVWGAWRVFVWGVPGSLLLLLFFFRTFSHRAPHIVFTSLFAWSMLAALYLQIAKWSLFPIFFLGIPLQAIILLFPFLWKKK